MGFDGLKINEANISDGRSFINLGNFFDFVKEKSHKTSMQKRVE